MWLAATSKKSQAARKEVLLGPICSAVMPDHHRQCPASMLFLSESTYAWKAPSYSGKLKENSERLKNGQAKRTVGMERNKANPERIR